MLVHLLTVYCKFSFQEELAEGLHLIDFEQLKIENQTYNEKIEERNEVRTELILYMPDTDVSHFLKSQILGSIYYR